MNEMNALSALRGYAGARPAVEPSGPTPAAQAAEGFASVVRRSEEAALAAMTGGADPQAMVEALARTQLAVEGAAAVRDRVVEAYQEILRMPV